MISLATLPMGKSSLAGCLSCNARALSFCSVLDSEALSRLAGLATVVEIGAGIGFIHEGESAEHFFNLTEGSAKVYKLLPDGRRQITGFVQAGDFLGLAAGRTYAFSAEALEPVRACRFSRPRLRAFLDDFPALERRLLEQASNELVVAQEQMLLLGRKTARERVASFLRSRAALVLATRDSDGLSLSMSRADIADYLGLTIETVSREFTALRKSAVIEIRNASEVTIRHPSALKLIADGASSFN
nr:cyclic nucleotide-binding domain-containing protein [uncultured Rhodopila sp.]